MGICAEYLACVIITVCNKLAVCSDAAPDPSLPATVALWSHSDGAMLTLTHGPRQLTGWRELQRFIARSSYD